MNFLRLRVDKHAQYEIRAYANAKHTKKWVPITYSAFIDYRVGGRVSSKGKIVIQKL